MLGWLGLSAGVLQKGAGNAQLSSPSKMPGMPTRSSGMPSSASASMFSGCSRANRDAKPGAVYWPLASPVLGTSSSFGGIAGGGSALEWRMRAMKSWWMTRPPPDDALKEELIVAGVVLLVRIAAVAESRWRGP